MNEQQNIKFIEANRRRARSGEQESFSFFFFSEGEHAEHTGQKQTH